MRISKRYHTRLRMQTAAFVVLFLAAMSLLAWLSYRYHFEADWSNSGRNTLSAASGQVLDAIPGPVTITAYASENGQLRQAIRDAIGRYQRHKADIRLDFVNPEREPELTRQLGIKMDGELVIAIGERSERISNLNEESVSNALQRLARNSNPWLVFLEGHGERKPRGIANHDLQSFTNHLEQKGFKVQNLNLAETPAIPNNTKVLVVASPQTDYLPGEVELLRKYVEHGGNLLWLMEPGPNLHKLEPVAETMGVGLQAGTIVDPTTQLFGLQDPRFALVSEYSPHPITRDFELMTVFPQAAGLEVIAKEGWEKEDLLTTVDRSWSETGTLKDEVKFDRGSDIPGPLTLGVALSRAREDTGGQEPGGQQRVVVIGDGDFLSNSILGNGGNLDLGLHIFNWLSQDDDLVTIPALTRNDTKLELGQTSQYILAFGFLIFLPLALAGSGIVIWLRRRKQ